MTFAVSTPEVNYKFMADASFKEKVDAAFKAQRTNLKDGTTALLEFFLEAPDDLKPLLLGQVRGRARGLLIADLLRWMEGEQPGAGGEEGTGGTPAKPRPRTGGPHDTALIVSDGADFTRGQGQSPGGVQKPPRRRQ